MSVRRNGKFISPSLCINSFIIFHCSDDFTLFLWDPSDDKKPLARMTGHQAPVNHISFSPDGRYVASAG